MLSRRTVLAGTCGTCVVAATGCATYGSGAVAAPAAVSTAAPTAAPPTATSAPPAATPSAEAEPAESAAAAAAAAEETEPTTTARAPVEPGLAATGDIPVGGGRIFAGEKVVVTQPAAGTFRAFSAVCTHQGCTVGKVSGETINCPCHGAAFAIDDGSVVAGPAPKALARREISVSDGQIYLA